MKILYKAAVAINVLLVLILSAQAAKYQATGGKRLPTVSRTSCTCTDPQYPDLSGWKCYRNCNTGFLGAGPVCYKACPANFIDDGLFCRKPAGFGRVGYPWKWGDSFNDLGMFVRCENDHGVGNCEKIGAVVYPKCSPGYEAVGVLCTPECPAGFNDFGISCLKPKYGRGFGIPCN